MKEEKVLINSLWTNYKISGNSLKTILILHGWGGSSDSWKKVIQILSNNFKVICPDLPGFGKSDFPTKPFTLDDYVNWLSLFSQKLNLSKFFLLGHSFGGRIAIKFSILNPQKIEKLILVNSAGIESYKTFPTRIAFFFAKVGNFLFSKKCFVQFKNFFSQIFYFLFRIQDYAKAKGVMRETMKNIVSEDLLSQLSKISCDTLIVWGKKDKILPLKYAFLFKEKIPNSQLIFLQNTGHSPHLEVPEKLSQVLLQNLT